MKELNQICFYAKDRIDISLLNEKTYISTENMLQNKEGVTISSNIPNVGKTQAYKKGDILISNIRPYFKKIWYATWDGGCSGDVLVIRAKQGISSRYLYAILSDDRFFTYSMASSKGTKMPRGDKESIMKYRIPDFNPEEQEKISKIVFDINDKIRINNGINDNLQQQDISIVKELALKCEIRKKIKNICNDVYAGGTPSRKKEEFWNNGTLMWFKNGEIKNNILLDSEEHINQIAIGNSSAKIVPKNSILFAMYCVSKPQLAINMCECTTNQAVCSLIINDFDIMCYVYYYLISFGHPLTNLANGAAQQNLNKGLIEEFEIEIPNENDIKNTELKNHVLYRMNLTEQNKKLTELRDALLPKLMSGEIDVSNIKLDL